MDSDIDEDELFSELKIVRKCLPKPKGNQKSN